MEKSEAVGVLNDHLAGTDGRDVARRKLSHYLNHAVLQSISKSGIYMWRLRAPGGTCRERDRRTLSGQGRDKRRRSATYARPHRPAQALRWRALSEMSKLRSDQQPNWQTQQPQNVVVHRSLSAE